MPLDTGVPNPPTDDTIQQPDAVTLTFIEKDVTVDVLEPWFKPSGCPVCAAPE